MTKGQVTVYIIIGIVILAILGGSYYAYTKFKSTTFQKELEKSSLVPSQIEPVKTYIDECLAETSEKAITLIGLQGGYINIPNDILPISQNNPFSNRLNILPNSDLKTAYWYYIKSNNIETQQIPSLENMQKELADYINLNLPSCLEGLSTFAENGYSIKKTSYSQTEVTILNDVIQIKTILPIQVKYKDIDFKLENHYSLIKSPLGSLYNTAKDIINLEINQNFLEEKTIDMLVTYDEIPFSSTEFTCNTRIWTKEQVQESLKNILQTNIAAIRIKDTDFIENPNTKYFISDIGSSNKDTSVNFMYSPSWPVNLEIEPSKGNVLIGDNYITLDNDMFTFLNTLFCLKDYHFVYDIKYPVLITLQQDSTIFQFALQVVLDNNQPRKNLLGNSEVTDTEPGICKNRNTEFTINAAYYVSDDSLKPLPGSLISFKCLNQICNLGETDSRGEIKTMVPQCGNALISAKKEGYYQGSLFTSTIQPSQVQVDLTPIYTQKLKVKIGDEYLKQIRDPYTSEQIIFTLKSKDYEKVIVYPGIEEIDLKPGDYQIESFVIGESTWPIQIQKQTIETCVETPRGILGIFGAKKEQCTTSDIPGYELEQVIKGGATFSYSVTNKDLAKSKELTLYTIVNALPTTNEEVMNIYENIKTNSNSNLFRNPELR